VSEHAPPPKSGRGPLLTVGIALGAVAVLIAISGIGVVGLGLFRAPARLTESQVAAKVDLSTVTVKASVFRGGTSEASGFFFGKRGHIVTDARVLTRATSISITDASGKSFAADLEGINRSRDIAELFTLDTAPNPLAGAHGAVSVGSAVLVIRNQSAGTANAFARGLVAGTNSDLTIDGKSFTNMIQTNATVSPADSGGPVVNTSGELIGVIAADSSNQAYATPLPTFDSEVASWVKAGNSVQLSPPPILESAESLILASVGSSFRRVKSEVWGTAGRHVAWTRPPTYRYGGTSVDIYLNVEPSDSKAETSYQTYVTEAAKNGFTNPIAASALGDESTTFQHSARDQVAYEVVWRDRNCIVVMYLAAAIPPYPDVSKPMLLGLAVQQESTLSANLANYQ